MLRRNVWKLFAGVRIPPVINERMDDFAPGTAPRDQTLAACKKFRGVVTDCPIIINGKEHRTGDVIKRFIPSDHAHLLATGYNATPALAQEAVESALLAKDDWAHLSFRSRAAIFLKAAHLISTKYRCDMRAGTMLGQSKNCYQAEIDVVAETCDFLRYSVKFAEMIMADQPISPDGGAVWNNTDYRPLEGFVSVIAPFNFSAIAANLVACPALLGNVVIWKPSPNAILSNYQIMKVLEEAGLPPGVINFLPCEPEVMGSVVNSHTELAGVAFTGSTRVFTAIQQDIGAKLHTYRNFPRVSGESGGKNFHLLHPSADVPLAVAGTLRSAFEYQGQKCSACARLYCPKSLWPKFQEELVAGASQLRVGQPDDFSSFMCAVIDEVAFDRIQSYIEGARHDPLCNIIFGGKGDKSKGYFVEPTIIHTSNPHSKTMIEEIFGPVLTVYVYDDAEPQAWENVARLVDSSTKYSLTGSIYCTDIDARYTASRILRYAAGNLYVNDKCTGAVVGQQPFGGARLSGSNDKPGSSIFLTRWISARTIKENFCPSAQVSYPHQLPDHVVIPPIS